MRLPSLNAIRAFEAVCRHGSILKAAEELGVVRGAVRQQLAILANHFGADLFDRDGRRLVPTPKAQIFAENATFAFTLLERAAADFAGEGARRLRLGVPSAFAIWWLMPRLAALQVQLSETEIDIVPMTVVEPLSRRADLDAVIMGGEYRPATGISSVRFMDDEFGPVARPDLAAGIANSPKNMSEMTCLSSRSAPSLWDEWFEESGTPFVAFARRQDFEDLLLAIGAARSGLGIALAPRASIEDDLARGLLAAPYGFTSRPAGYSLCCRAPDMKSRDMTGLREWLLQAGQAG
jgi:DNA-binding transcriptional LysR family regulator